MKKMTKFIGTGIALWSVLFLSVLVMSAGIAQQEGTLTVVVDNIQNTKGSIAIGVYKDADSFKKGEPFKKVIVPKTKASNKQLQFEVPLSAGTYGIALLDDENDNRKMDYRFAFPKEGYGFSNHVHKSWSRPSFDQFTFYHSGKQTTINITVQYF